MTNLFISAYPEKDQIRKAELRTCLLNNLKSGVFDAVWIIAEEDGHELKYLPNVKPYTVNILPCTTRPTFRTFFNAINNIDDMLKKVVNSSIGKHEHGVNVGMLQIQPEENVYIIANSDIYFESLPVLPKVNECFALCRYDIQKDGSAIFLNRNDAQDTWLFKGKIKIPQYCDFHMGTPGCDNRVNVELSRMGYEILNPSLTIKSYHLHSNPTNHIGKQKVNPPYLRLNPILL